MFNNINIPNVLATLDAEIERLNDYTAYLTKENEKLSEENKKLKSMLDSAIDAHVTCHDEMGNEVVVKTVNYGSV